MVTRRGILQTNLPGVCLLAGLIVFPVNLQAEATEPLPTTVTLTQPDNQQIPSLFLTGSQSRAASQDNPHRPRYLTIAKQPDPDYLLAQSYTLAGASFVTIGLMTLLPEETTNWDSDSRKLDNLSDKWWDNITAGPQWDNDDDYLNYVMHPYFGGVYYTAARHAGYDRYDAFLYSFAVSTFFWECGVEAFTERPSIQDIVVTPIFGAWAGDAMLYREQQILANNGMVMGSKALGDISLFFLNPVGHIHHWVTDAWGDNTNLSFYYHPRRYQISLHLTF